ncbi:3-dehydro-L-gulonate 2-dehydrogenase [Propionivibrio dicarboxylicus]|uniref:3-dehydro-L-gulonate 2-dehydrogenase n=1 Tax=Propionivibrio dicarboxylicus TaxID=83767 RepID=A0A1G8D314_9RHOO|nr:3-dehydro-L-gulonate 2-dehydrogenase [Propionivibrio dicarboxylicus]SDH51924.1 3-dehydro-L-gulonate 2-dehydrogenase [Propionivibrio dicarboxylicus]
MTRVAFELMHEVVTEAFVKAGMAPDEADICAKVHTESSCDGVYSHGLNRVARFVDYLQRGWVLADAKPECVKTLGSIEIYDGKQGPGILNALFATDRAMELAAEQGVGIVALRNTTHWMRGGSYGWRAADKGFAAISWTNTESCMPAWGGKNPRLGNNPFVMAVPRKKGHIVLDMAMSQYSYGKLQVTRLKGEQLPYPGGFDAEGNLTTEPGPIEKTMRILPIGYWKGSAFAIVLDALAAVLSEGHPTSEIDQIQRGSCTGCSQVFIVFDPRQLGGEEFSDRVADSVAAYVNGSEPTESDGRVTYPGESTLRKRLDQQANGIVVDEGVWAEVLKLAGRA